MIRPLAIFVALISLALAACGGGGGGSSPTPSTIGPTTSPTTAPTTTPTTVTMTGTAVELVSGAPLAGFTVTVGTAPSTLTCSAAQTSTANPCGVPAGTTTTTTTAANGTFSMTIPAGTSMMTIGKDTTYATLHRTVSSASPAPGTVNVAALSADEQAWLVDINAVRALIAVPTSYANLTVDEFAEEQARTEANAVANGTAAYGDATETTYLGLYGAMPNLVYASAGSVQAVQHDPLGFPVTYGTTPLTVTLPATAHGYQGADAAWMYGEVQNCPGDNWKSCTFSLAGHYINLSNTLDVWAGLGESTVSSTALGGKVYEIITPQS